MTLIRRMHSLGRGEGRAGLLSHSKDMHELQDGTGLRSRCEGKLCHWAVWLSATGDWGCVEVPLKLSLRDHASCGVNLFYGGLLPGKKKDERETERKRDRDTTTTMNKMIFPETWFKVHCDILRNHPPLNKSKGRNIFLNSDSVKTLWHCSIEFKA